VTAAAPDIAVGQAVKVSRGLLRGRRGTVRSLDGSHALVAIDGAGDARIPLADLVVVPS